MNASIISSIDFLLVPLYFLVLYVLIRFIKNKYPNDILIQKYLAKAFVVKIFGGLLYALLVYYYWGFGDTLTYFKESLVFKDLIEAGKISLIDVFSKDYTFFRENYEMRGAINNSGFVVVKISLLLTYIGFNRFLICTMLMSFIALFGVFKLFEAFVSFAPKWHFLIAIVILFFPSLNIYGAGLLKDNICFTSLGCFFYGCINISKRKAKWTDYLYVFVAAYLILIIKAYIIAALFIPLLMFICMNLLRKIRLKFFRWMAFPLIVLFFSSTIFIFYDDINEGLGAYAIEHLQENIVELKDSYATLNEDADSNFDIGDMEPNVAGILKKLPTGFVATLYRPFVWEVRKPIMVLSAIESLFLVFFSVFVIIKVGILKFAKYFTINPIIFLCLLYSIIFASLVGISTVNFGTLARYRIPVIPFYYMGFLLVFYEFKTEVKKKQIQNVV